MTPVRSPSVVFAWLYEEWGGAEVQLLQFARHAPDGVDIVVMAPHGTDRTLRDEWATVRHEWLDLDHPVDLSTARSTKDRLVRRWRDVRAGAELVRRLRRFPPGTAVHVDLPTWSTALALRLLGRRHEVFLTWHTPMGVPTGGRGRYLLAKHRFVGRSRHLHLVAASETARDDAARWFGRPIEQIVEVLTGFDPIEIAGAADADPLDVAGRWGLRAGVPTVVGVGALIPRKGVDVALRAVDHLRTEGVDVQLLWIGDGPDRPDLEVLRSDLGLDESVALVAPDELQPNRLEMLAAIAGADVYVQPSRVDGLPLALVDALASGVPVVVTPVGAVHEVVAPDGDDARAGLTVPIGDHVALAVAIERIVTDGDLARHLAHRGQRAVADRDITPSAQAMFDRYASASSRGVRR